MVPKVSFVGGNFYGVLYSECPLEVPLYNICDPLNYSTIY